jgi:hypothetical protein
LRGFGVELQQVGSSSQRGSIGGRDGVGDLEKVLEVVHIEGKMAGEFVGKWENVSFGG